MTDKVVLRVENTISNQLEPVVRRIDQLEAAVEELTYLGKPLAEMTSLQCCN
jgi:hypothetical protein